MENPTTLYSRTSENIRLKEAIDKCISKLDGAIAIIYSPQSCQLLKLHSDGNLWGYNRYHRQEKYEKIELDYQENYIFEARIFNEDYELRWLNENEGKGKAVIISEENLDNCLENDFKKLVAINVIPQQYLLWGEKAKTELNQTGWQKLSSARIGSLNVPINQEISDNERVYLHSVEYLNSVDDYGNVAVVEERLLSIEIDETDYIFKSQANKKRLLQAVENVKQRKNLVEVNLENIEEVNEEKILFENLAFEDFNQWKSLDKKIYDKIVKLIKDVQCSSCIGLGKQKPLKHELSGYFSRRITDQHRLVYQVNDHEIIIIACKYHYSK